MLTVSLFCGGRQEVRNRLVLFLNFHHKYFILKIDYKFYLKGVVHLGKNVELKVPEAFGATGRVLLKLSAQHRDKGSVCLCVPSRT